MFGFFVGFFFQRNNRAPTTSDHRANTWDILRTVPLVASQKASSQEDLAKEERSEQKK